MERNIKRIVDIKVVQFEKANGMHNFRTKKINEIYFVNVVIYK